MKLLEPVLLPETTTYIDDRFGRHPRLLWWTGCVPRLAAWLYGKNELYCNGETREGGLRGIQIWPAWGGLIWALWNHGAALWPWLFFLVLLFAVVTREAVAGIAAGFVLFGVTAASYWAGRTAGELLGLHGGVTIGIAVIAVLVALRLVYRSIVQFEPIEVPNYDGEPIGRRV